MFNRSIGSMQFFFLKISVIIFDLNYQCLQRAGVAIWHKLILSFSRILDGQLQRRRSMYLTSPDLRLFFMRSAIFSRIFRRHLLPGHLSHDSRTLKKNQIVVLNNNSGEESSASLKAGTNQIIQNQTANLASSNVFFPIFSCCVINQHPKRDLTLNDDRFFKSFSSHLDSQVPSEVIL